MTNFSKKLPTFEHYCFICNQTFLSTKKRQIDFCVPCRSLPTIKIMRRLLIHLERARRAGLPATLTLEEWQEAIEYFNGMCAYCQRRPYICIEHYIPLELGGGTTRENIVPACHGCNHKKASHHPESIFPKNTIDRIQLYLCRRSEAM